MAKPVLSDPIALRLPEEMLKEIETIAAATERTRSWVIVRALKYYLAAEGKDILDILEAKEQVRRGEVMDMDDLLKELEAENARDNAKRHDAA
jgi:predicted transcriptional regulator